MVDPLLVATCWHLASWAGKQAREEMLLVCWGGGGGRQQPASTPTINIYDGQPAQGVHTLKGSAYAGQNRQTEGGRGRAKNACDGVSLVDNTHAHTDFPQSQSCHKTWELQAEV